MNQAQRVRWLAGLGACLLVAVSAVAAFSQRGPGKPLESDEGYGNNLSNPVVFAEGIGLLGLPVTNEGVADYLATGFRPTAAEMIEVDALPFDAFVDPPRCVTVDGVNVCAYPQQTESTWQAQWIDALEELELPVLAEVDWSDNLVRQSWTTRSVVRVEVVLNAPPDFPEQFPALEGYETVYLLGQGQTELQGATGAIAEYPPTIYSVCPRLTIEKIDGEGGEALYTVHDYKIADNFGVDGPGGYSAEVNVAGKLIYGFNWMLRNDSVPAAEDQEGWYRITFSLEDEVEYTIGDEPYTVECNTLLTSLNIDDVEGDNILYAPQLDPSGASTSIDIYIFPNRKGGNRDNNPAKGKNK